MKIPLKKTQCSFLLSRGFIPISPPSRTESILEIQRKLHTGTISYLPLLTKQASMTKVLSKKNLDAK